MIVITDKSKCCGCEACVQVCPKHCIAFIQDKEGFSYPEVSTDICVDCGLCEKVCPELSVYEETIPLEVISAINKDEDVRASSSSGGVFTLLAQKTIEQGGIVFGVRFDEKWLAVFDYADTLESVAAFRGSKYLQARVGDCYVQCKKNLDEGRHVLFAGTQCQIAALNHYLRKTYPNLLTVDFICHGVPSPAVWRQYLEEIKEDAHKGENSVSLPLNPPISGNDALAGGREVEIESIAFRDKRLGWKKFSFALTLAEAIADGKKNSVSLSFIHYENLFMKAFLSNLILRPSCYSCPSKGGRSNADITIADFWGIEKVTPNMDDDKGTSLVLINTQKGADALQREKLTWANATYEDVLKFNPSISNPATKHPRREEFFSHFSDDVNLHELIDYSLRPSLKQHIKRILKYPIKVIRRILLVGPVSQVSC